MVFFLIMPLGAAIGAGLAFWLLRHAEGPAEILRQGGLAALILAFVIGLPSLGLWYFSPGRAAPAAEGKALVLEVELMAEAPDTLPADIRALDLRLELASTWELREPIPLHFDKSRREGDFIVIPGAIPLTNSYANRVIYPLRGDDYNAEFDLPIPADPGLHYLDWSPWEKPSAGNPDIGQRFQLRYRVRPAGE